MPFELLPQSWSSEWVHKQVSLCMGLLRGMLLPTSFNYNIYWFSETEVVGPFLPSTEPCAGEPSVKLGTLWDRWKVCRKKCLSPLDWLWVWKFHAQVDVMVSDGLLFVLDNCWNSFLEVDSKFQHTVKNVGSLLLVNFPCLFLPPSSLL